MLADKMKSLIQILTDRVEEEEEEEEADAGVFMNRRALLLNL